MAEEGEKPVVARNLQALIGKESVNSWAKRHGMTQTTINRIVTGKMDPTVGLLDRLAKAISAHNSHVEGWQLMVEGFDPKNPPVLLRAGSPEHRLYERIAGFTLEQHAEGPSSGGDRWVSPDIHPRRRASDQ